MTPLSHLASNSLTLLVRKSEPMPERSPYAQLFHASPDQLEARKAAVVRAAFDCHLRELGPTRYMTGNSLVSVPNYFATHVTNQSGYHTPINNVALGLLPSVTQQSDGTERADYLIHRRILAAGRNSEAVAARQGKWAEWRVVTKLGLVALPEISGINPRIITATGREIARGINGGVVDELPVIAKMVRDNGYEDFCEYLEGSQRQLAGIADTIFEEGPPNVPQRQGRDFSRDAFGLLTSVGSASSTNLA